MGSSPVDLLKEFGEISQLGKKKKKKKKTKWWKRKHRDIARKWGFYRDLFPPFFEIKNNVNSHIYDRPRHFLSCPLW
jgi:hypothetical protein